MKTIKFFFIIICLYSIQIIPAAAELKKQLSIHDLLTHTKTELARFQQLKRDSNQPNIPNTIHVSSLGSQLGILTALDIIDKKLDQLLDKNKLG